MLNHFVPVVHLVEVLGLDHEAPHLQGEVVVGSPFLPGDGEVVFQIRTRQASTLQDTLRLCVHVVQVQVREGVILKKIHPVNITIFAITTFLKKNKNNIFEKTIIERTAFFERTNF